MNIIIIIIHIITIYVCNMIKNNNSLTFLIKMCGRQTVDSSIF